MKAATKAATKAPTPNPTEQELPLDAPVNGGAMVRHEERAVGAAVAPMMAGDSGSITQLLHKAVEQGTPVEALEKLVDLHERLAQREAAQEFYRALSAFKAECPRIGKSKTAEITTKGGGKYSYTFAPLDETTRVIDPILARHGLSYGFDSRVEAGMLTCTCTLRHINGHSVPSNFTLPTENASAMSPQQKIAAALTFAMRKSLESALGITPTEEDNDAAAREIDPTPITADQLDELEDLIEDGQVNRPRFLAFLQVEKLGELPAARYPEAKNALMQKRERRGGRGS